MASVHVRSIITVLAGVLTAGQSAWAQFGATSPDLSGSWSGFFGEDTFERAIPGPLPGDFTGLALNEAGKALAVSASVSRYTTIERQCALWPPQYLVLGPMPLKIMSEGDPITGKTIAYHIAAWEDRPATVIWLDGRPHPSANAPHTKGGFETGQWRGNTLTTRTTHIKAGILRRNGAQISDRSTLHTHYILNGDLLTALMFIDDPVYLSEPQAFSRDFQLSNLSNTVASSGPPCIPVFEGAGADSVAHFLPGQNPTLGELTKRYGIPREAAAGGAETMYPEFRKKIKDAYVRPEKCLEDCIAGPPPGLLNLPPGFPTGAPPK